MCIVLRCHIDGLSIRTPLGHLELCSDPSFTTVKSSLMLSALFLNCALCRDVSISSPSLLSLLFPKPTLAEHFVTVGNLTKDLGGAGSGQKADRTRSGQLHRVLLSLSLSGAKCLPLPVSAAAQGSPWVVSTRPGLGECVSLILHRLSKAFISI